MEIIIVLTAGILVAAVVFAGYSRYRRDSAEFSSRFDFSDEGIIERKPNHSLQFQGKGAQTTRSVTLEAGDYKIRYKFPEGVRGKVELLSEDGSDGEIIVIKSGAGEAAFTVTRGRYLFDIDPQDETAAWKLEITRLGLPSGYKPSPH